MSKKTIAFTMPAGSRSRQRGPVVIDGVTGESVPLASADEPDEWVRDRDLLGGGDALQMAASPPLGPLAAGGSLTINLAADRNLIEAMALSCVVPFALGWFWCLNAMARPYRVWGF